NALQTVFRLKHIVPLVREDFSHEAHVLGIVFDAQDSLLHDSLSPSVYWMITQYSVIFHTDFKLLIQFPGPDRLIARCDAGPFRAITAQMTVNWFFVAQN